MKYLLCLLPLLTGCVPDEYKCIDNIIYIKRGGIWKQDYPKWECHPVEEKA